MISEPTLGRVVLAPASRAARPSPKSTKATLAEAHRLLREAVELLRTLRPPGELITQDRAWDQILALTAKEFRCSEADITTTQRTATAAHCRGVVSLLAKRYLGLTGTQLDARWGKSSGAIHHAIRTVENRIATEPAFRASVARIEGFLVAVCHFTPVP
jgi:chromosomal replication initiation ATPase DnaA